jgi:hypothetical protein
MAWLIMFVYYPPQRRGPLGFVISKLNLFWRGCRLHLCCTSFLRGATKIKCRCHRGGFLQNQEIAVRLATPLP